MAWRPAPWSVGYDTDFRSTGRWRAAERAASSAPHCPLCWPASGTTGDTPLDPARAGARLTLAWEHHDNSVSYWGGARPHPDVMLEQWLGRSRHDMTVGEYVYWAGVVQGIGLSEYIRNFRRRMFSTASAIFWMYNDCWPTTRSWTIVDYYGRRTPAFYPVRRVSAGQRRHRRRRRTSSRSPTRAAPYVRCGLFALDGSRMADMTLPVTSANER